MTEEVTLEKLAERMGKGFQSVKGQIDQKIDGLALIVAKGFEGVDKRFDGVDKRFDENTREHKEIFRELFEMRKEHEEMMGKLS